MHAFVLSAPSRCIGCRACEIACVDAHMDEDMGEAGEKKLPFSPRLSIVHEAEVTAPVQCRQCEDAPCVAACPVGAILSDGKAVRVNTVDCVGCKACLAVCPIGAMQVGCLPESSTRLVAHKCDLCTGRELGPACIAVCPAGALTLLTRKELKNISSSRRCHSALQAAYRNS
ncbi:4Fe-4S dicluster domain-containing protein [Halodesulfovibrio marinisediminis]|uniref:Electron transport protein HydN n=1 Tax=Halodesulfovibrio marinisediminis DSM 17456 TaxID=1121457 RepID=A0A1N6DNJ7_9BACT|nr:4Fe-4S dicluster domain-containing protein [Halodesulfovibrio marinisediminis]SIN72372.1 electron transport protein HydN [Halodesulfovibrio marinisediminis DSM 17456]